MKKIFLVLLAALLLLSACQRGSRMPSYDDLLGTIADLEEENSRLNELLDSSPEYIYEEITDNSDLDYVLFHIEDDLSALFGYFDDSSYTLEEASEAFNHLYSVISPYY